MFNILSYRLQMISRKQLKNSVKLIKQVHACLRKANFPVILLKIKYSVSKPKHFRSLQVWCKDPLRKFMQTQQNHSGSQKQPRFSSSENDCYAKDPTDEIDFINFKNENTDFEQVPSISVFKTGKESHQTNKNCIQRSIH